MRKDICGMKAVAVSVAVGVLLIGGTLVGAAPAPQHNGQKPETLQVAGKDMKATKEKRRAVRDERSRPGAFQFDLARSQPVFVKAFDTSEAVFENTTPVQGEEAKQQKKMAADLLQKKMVEKLKVFRFDAKPYPEDEGKANVKGALVIDGAISKITFGKVDTLCTIKVRICPQEDPKKVLGQYEDGGNTASLANRVGKRFESTAKD